METEINNIEDVDRFFEMLCKDYSLNFHPDNSFNEYVNLATGEKTFTEDESYYLDGVTEDCFVECKESEVDIYDLAEEVYKTLKAK